MAKNVTIKINADSASAEKAVKDLKKSMDAFDKSLKKADKTASSLSTAAKLGGAISGVKSAFDMAAAAVSKVRATVTDLIDTYKVQAQAETQLEAAARNNPYLNDYSVSKLKAFAGELQSISTYGDEQMLPLMAQLASAGRTQAEIMDIMSAAVDVAASGTMSLESAVKSLNGTYSGQLGTLSKALPQLKDLTAEELKNGAAVKQAAKAYSGQAEAVAKSTGGWQQAKNAFGDFKEVLGSGIADIQNRTGQVLTAFFSDLTSAITSADEKAQEFKATIQAIADLQDKDASSAALEASAAAIEEKLEQYKKVKAALGKTPAEFAQAAKDARDAYYKSAEYKELLEAYKEAEAQTKNPLLTGYAAAEAADKYNKALEKLNAAKQPYEEAVRNASKELVQLNGVFMSDFAGNAADLDATIAEFTARLEAARETIAAASAREEEAAGAASRAASRADANKTAEDALKKYRETVAAKKEELRERELIGEKLTEEQKAQELLNTMTSAYLAMRKEAGSTISDENENLKSIHAEIADTMALAAKPAPAAADGFADVLKNAQAVLKSAFDGDLDDIDALEAKLHELEHVYGEMMEEMAANPALSESPEWNAAVEAARASMDAIQRLVQDAAANMRGSFREQLKAVADDIEGQFEQVKQFTDAFSEMMNIMLTMQKDTIATQAENEKAALEEQFAAGIISADEYNDRMDEIDREAARRTYELEMAEWTNQLVQAQAATAMAVLQALASNSGHPAVSIALAATMAALGAVQTAQIAAAKPIPPKFAEGGYVPGASYSGDKVPALLNSGELVLNRREQAVVRSLAGSGAGAGGANVSVNVHNTQSRDVQANVQRGADGALEIFIQRTVAGQLQQGRYNRQLQSAQSSFAGQRYTN